MGKFRKKPVEVIAYQLRPEIAEEIALWCGGRLVEELDPLEAGKTYVGLNIPTLLGVKRASEGDWVIQGAAGEFSSCKAYDFQATYEEV